MDPNEWAIVARGDVCVPKYLFERHLACDLVILTSVCFDFSFVFQTEHIATHKRFINECYKKLEGLLSNFRECNNATTGPKEGKISKTFKKPIPVKDYSMER